jgi:hypothetical protein
VDNNEEMKWIVDYFQMGVDDLNDALADGWEPYAVHYADGAIWVHVRRQESE